MRKRFRVFDTERQQYTKPQDWSLGVESGMVRGTYGEEFPEMVAEQYLGLQDKNGVEACVGDLRMYGGKKYKITDWEWCYIFERNLVEFGDNETIVIGEDEIWESDIVGFYLQDKANDNLKK